MYIIVECQIVLLFQELLLFGGGLHSLYLHSYTVFWGLLFTVVSVLLIKLGETIFAKAVRVRGHVSIFCMCRSMLKCCIIVTPQILPPTTKLS